MVSNAKLLDGMVVFVEVVNSGSFTQAAHNTGHSTSYISKEITQLEGRLGVRLLNRTTRSLSLTPEGELYFQQSQQIVLDAEQAESTMSGHQQEPKGILRISCVVGFGLSQLKAILPQFIERYPQVEIDLDLNDRKVDIISEGFDILIRASGQLDESSLISRRLMRAYGIAIASPEYLAKHGTPTDPVELSNHRTISYSNLKNPKTWVYKDLDHQTRKVQLNSQVITNSAEMELGLCLAGQGITRLPSFNLRDEIQSGALIELFQNYPRQEIDVYLVYPSRKHMSSRVRCFIDFMVDSLDSVRISR